MEQFNEETLLAWLKATGDGNRCADHDAFLEWKNGTASLVDSLEEVGQMEVEPAPDQNNLPYWGADAPIQADNYPYYVCAVFQCKICGTAFFHYLELGGHWPQERYRVIRQELFVSSRR